MNIVSFLAFMLLASLSYTSFYLSQRAYGDYFAPLGLFSGVNLASLSLYQLDLLPLIPVSLQAYTLIAASLFSFIVGALIASPFLTLKGRPLPRQSLFRKTMEAPEGLVLFYYLTASFGIASWIFYVTRVVSPGWLSKPWLLQGKYIFPYHMGYLLLAGSLGPPSFVLLGLMRHRVTLLAVYFLLGDVIALALCGIKSYLVIALATSLLVWAAARPGKIRIKHLVILAVLLLGFMVLYDRFIDIFISWHFVESRVPGALSFLKRPYLYTVGPWPAMSEVMANPPKPAHWAQLTLEPLWKLLGPGGLGLIVERVPQFSPFVNIGPSSFNTYSLIGGLYWDYGWLGSILGCFFLGFISSRLYITARKRRDWILYLLNGVFSYGLLISFFVYYYRSDLIFLLLYVLVVGPLSRKLSLAFKQYKIHVLYPKRADRRIMP